MEYALTVGIAFAVFVVIAAALTSWRVTASLMLLLAILSLHLDLPVVIPIESGVTIHFADVFFSGLAIATLFRLIQPFVGGRYFKLWLIFSFFLGFTFLSGVLTYGLFAAAAAYRASFYMTLGIIYFATFKYDEKLIGQMFWLHVTVGWILIFCGVVAWMVPELRPTGSGNISAGTMYSYERNRALPAQAALFIAFAFFTTIPAWLDERGSLIQRLSTVPFLACGILLFHRSVWVVLLVGMSVVVTALGRGAFRMLLVLLVALLLLLAFWLGLLALDADVFSDSLRTAVAEVDRGNSTLNWRIDGWRILVGRAIDNGPLSILFGSGFGTGFERTIGTGYVVVAPHNYYVELFLTSGVVGGTLFAVALMMLAYALFRSRVNFPPGVAHVIVTVIVGLMVYCLTYSPHYDAAPILGMAVSLVAGSARRSSPLSSPA